MDYGERLLENHLPRKLAAILYADVVDYSRLTGDDEDGTHRLLREYLELIASSIESQGGRVVHYAGDAVLADFNTVLDAMTCAIRIQQEIIDRNREVPSERRVLFRIGVNLGDVIVDRSEIYGEGVNVAARLESLAEPGGICISDAVRVSLGNKLSLTFSDLGNQEVKNIKEPIHVWHWAGDSGIPTPAPGCLSRNPHYSSGPTIAVLPFENLGGNEEAGSLADGLTDELVTAFSRQTGINVLSRRSTLAIKDESIDGEGVQGSRIHYILEGSVRQSGVRVRVAARLIDAETGSDLWGDQYDGTLDDVFALQDEIRLSIVAGTRSQIHVKDANRVRNLPENELSVGELLSLASQSMQRLGLEDYLQAERLLKLARERSPENPMALAMSASCVLLKNDFDYRTVSRSGADDALELVEKSIQLNEESDYAHYVRGKLLLQTKNQPKQAIAEAERALELNPNYTYAYALLGYARICLGNPDDGIALIKKAIRADPRRAGNVDFYPFVAVGYYLKEDYDAAIQWLENAAQRKGYTPYLRFVLAGYHSLAGDDENALTHLNAALKRVPEASIDELRVPPFRHEADARRFLVGLRKLDWTRSG